MKTMITIASRQVWPQVICVKKIAPQKIYLLHSRNEEESHGPALRLSEFMTKNHLCADVYLHEAPDNDPLCFAKTFEALLSGIKNSDEVTVNITGGNKLMTISMYNQAVKKRMKIVYLERNKELFYFLPPDYLENPKKEDMDTSITNDLDPLELLKCQLGGSYVNNDGECLVLSNEGKMQNLEEINVKLAKSVSFADANIPYENYLVRTDGERVRREEGKTARFGSHMEYIVAFVLLKLGIPRVYRGAMLAPLNLHGAIEGELDLVFNHRGRLWLVDCKDKKKSSEGINEIRRSMIQSIETGGILAKTIYVRTKLIPDNVNAYAKSRGVETVYKNNLFNGLKEILMR